MIDSREPSDKIGAIVSRLKNYELPEIRQTYDFRNAIQYALGIGLGVPATDPEQLPFLYEGLGPLVLPSMASVLATPGFWMQDPALCLPWQNVLHLSEELEIHKALSAEGTLVGATRIEALYDKGPNRGAVLVTRHDLTDLDGTPVATTRKCEYCRGLGGFGGAPGPSAVTAPPPEHEPDLIADWRFPEQAAVLYRLSGDLNPLHIDPEIARAAGFERPILHGLCTLGALCWLVVRDLCEGDPTRLRFFAAHFTAPVFPGDRIRLSAWEGTGGYSFIASRNGQQVISGGRMRRA